MTEPPLRRLAGGGVYDPAAQLGTHRDNDLAVAHDVLGDRCHGKVCSGWSSAGVDILQHANPENRSFGQRIRRPGNIGDDAVVGIVRRRIEAAAHCRAAEL